MDEEDIGLDGVVGRMGRWTLACDCENKLWLIGVSKAGQNLVIICPFCGAMSGEMIPKSEEDLRAMTEAAKEIHRAKREKPKELDWGDATETKPPDSNLKN